jgi:hypothetical protein
MHVAVHVFENTAGKVLSFFTGEGLLRYRSNSGPIILVRTIWTSFWIYTFALALANMRNWNWHPSFWHQSLYSHAPDHIEWLGAIAAVVYAAYYARFSSQWTYLANLYNQIKQLEVELQPQPTVALSQRVCHAASLAALKAAFIEDAKTLHLAGQKSFKYAVARWAKQPCVIPAFAGSSDDEKKELRRITDVAEKSMNKSFTSGASHVCRAFPGYVVSTEPDGDDQCPGFRDLRDVLADGRPQPGSA